MTDRFVENFNRDKSKQIIMETDQGYITIKRVNESLVLMLVSSDKAQLGMIMLYMGNTIKRINEVFN